MYLKQTIIDLRYHNNYTILEVNIYFHLINTFSWAQYQTDYLNKPTFIS